VDVFVDELDLMNMGASPAATGRRSYHPLLLPKLYAYLNRIQSSCELQRKWRA
jgi:transposase